MFRSVPASPQPSLPVRVITASVNDIHCLCDIGGMWELFPIGWVGGHGLTTTQSLNVHGPIWVSRQIGRAFHVFDELRLSL
ncbi:uncharacterized protein METZ01_LOCUS408930 [marine metagenome]|uniref:Uncharacterized protein n=1 Tax=marine metagenome TaxID=408172 RepID=A0A382WB29_9ZZZZ